MTDLERSREIIINAIMQCPDPELRGRADQALTTLVLQLMRANGRIQSLEEAIVTAQAALRGM